MPRAARGQPAALFFHDGDRYISIDYRLGQAIDRQLRRSAKGASHAHQETVGY